MPIMSVDEFVDKLLALPGGHVCSETPIVIVFDEREFEIVSIETTGTHEPLRLIAGRKLALGETRPTRA